MKHIPQIEFRVSWVHNLMFDKNRYLPKQKRDSQKYSPQDGEALSKVNQPFLKAWRKIEQQVLSHIPIFTGFHWKDKIIQVYLSDTVPNSYEDPLTLKLDIPPLRMCFDLIHELVHRNIPSSIQNSLPDADRERIMDAVTERIALMLELDVTTYPLFTVRQVDLIREELLNKTVRDWIRANI